MKAPSVITPPSFVVVLYCDNLRVYVPPGLGWNLVGTYESHLPDVRMITGAF